MTREIEEKILTKIIQNTLRFCESFWESFFGKYLLHTVVTQQAGKEVSIFVKSQISITCLVITKHFIKKNSESAWLRIEMRSSQALPANSLDVFQ